MAGTKKELVVFHEWNDALYQLKFVGGGELPAALKSKYTSKKEAERWRDMYYAGKLPKKQTIQTAKELEASKVVKEKA